MQKKNAFIPYPRTRQHLYQHYRDQHVVSLGVQFPYIRSIKVKQGSSNSNMQNVPEGRM